MIAATFWFMVVPEELQKEVIPISESESSDSGKQSSEYN